MTRPVPHPVPPTSPVELTETPSAHGWNLHGNLAAQAESSTRHVAISLTSSGVAQVVLVASLALVQGTFHGLLMRFPPPPGTQSVASAPSAESIEVAPPDANDEPEKSTPVEITVVAELERLVEPPAARSVPISPAGDLAPTRSDAKFHQLGQAAISESQASETPPVAKQRSEDSPTIRPQIELSKSGVPKAIPKREVAQDKIPLPASSPSQPSEEMDGAKNELPRAVYNPSPDYPADALAARITGRVLLRVRVAVDGSVEAVSVHRTSGVTSLDNAALAAVRRWRFQPARNNQTPKATDIVVPVRFILEE